MQKIYLAAPYSSPHADIRESRVAEASRVAARLMEQGYVVFSPITHGNAVADHLPKACLLSHEFWMRQCLSMLEVCDWLIILPLEGWRESRGLEVERRHAEAKHIPAFFWQEVHPAVDMLDDEEIEYCNHSIFKGVSNG